MLELEGISLISLNLGLTISWTALVHQSLRCREFHGIMVLSLERNRDRGCGLYIQICKAELILLPKILSRFVNFFYICHINSVRTPIYFGKFMQLYRPTLSLPSWAAESCCRILRGWAWLALSANRDRWTDLLCR